jgi:hypothetical protein
LLEGERYNLNPELVIKGNTLWLLPDYHKERIPRFALLMAVGLAEMKNEPTIAVRFTKALIGDMSKSLVRKSRH